MGKKNSLKENSKKEPIRKRILKEEFLSISGKNTKGKPFVTKVRRDIEGLYFSYKNLVTLDLVPIESCKHISTLNLSDNKFQTVDLSPLLHLKRLTTLRLCNNELKQIDLQPLLNLKRLSTLNLENNKLRQIDLRGISGCDKISVINLKKNLLEYVDLEPLFFKKELKTLYLDKNPLKELDISSLFSCQKLSKFKIDSKVELIANEEYKYPEVLPTALENLFYKINWYELETDVESPQIPDTSIVYDSIEDRRLNVQKSFHLPPFYCQLCEAKHSAGTERYLCENCARYICLNSYSEMINAGRTNCPMCEGQLVKLS